MGKQSRETVVWVGIILIGMLMGSVLGILMNQESSRVSREPRARGGSADARRDGRRRVSVV